MIASDVDGLSRGNNDAGVLLGIDVRQFLPMNLSAWDVVGEVLAGWCKSWMDTDCGLSAGISLVSIFGPLRRR